MKRKILIVSIMMMLFVLLFTLSVSAKDAYVEPVPEHLVDEGEVLEYFIVLDGEEYYGASGSTLDSLNSSSIESALNKLAENSEYTDAVTALGTKYLLKLVLPAQINGTSIAHVYVNNDAFKKKDYFMNKCGALVYAPTHTSTGDGNECANVLRTIDFGENSQIKTIPLCYMGKASQLRELKNIPAKLDSIEKSAFAYCSKLSGVLYLNATTIKEKAFENAIVRVDGIILGPDTVNIATEAFGTREVNEGSKSTKFIEFQCDVTKMNIVASAENQGAFYFEKGVQRNPYSALTCLILSHPSNQAMITEGETTFQSFLPNVYFNEASKTTGNLVIKGHHNLETVDYENGFLANGIKNGACKDCGHVADSVVLEPLFKCNGYSVPEDGSNGIVVGYSVNKIAIAEYERITQKTVAYGVFAVAEEKLGENKIFNSEGVASNGVISTEISSYDFDRFDLIITNFADALKDKNLAMGAYALVDGEYSYLQAGTPSEGASYSFVSYNYVKNLLQEGDENEI